MEIWLIILAVWVLYSRTWLGKNRSYYIIDDNVRRWEYLYVVPESSPHPTWYSTKPHPWRFFFLILTHCLNVWVINLLFGWQVAMLFAFNPLSVNGTAWITGGYYAVTAFLTLTAFYFITNFPNVFGAITSSLFYTAALGSTITCIGMPFIFLLSGSKWGLVWFWPLLTYLFGKRFRAGFKIRNDGKKDKITWRKPAVMMKVVAYYIRIALFPDKLAFFRDFGYKYNREDGYKRWMDSYNKDFWVATLVVGTFAYVGWQFSPLGTLWFLACIGPFSQFKLLGQFIAERYLYLPNVGLALIMGNMLAGHDVALAVVTTLYAYRSHLYIPAFNNIISLYKNGIANYPDSGSNYFNLGERYLHINETLKAYRTLSEGLALDPDSFLGHTNLAAYWITVRNYNRALMHTDEALKYKGQNGLAERILGTQRQQLVKIIEKMKEPIKWDIDNDAKKEKEHEKIQIAFGSDVLRQEVLAG